MLLQCLMLTWLPHAVSCAVDLDGPGCSGPVLCDTCRAAWQSMLYTRGEGADAHTDPHVVSCRADSDGSGSLELVPCVRSGVWDSLLLC